MTIKDLQKKIKKYWWIPILSTLIFTAAFLPSLLKEQYEGNLTVGINVDSKEIFWEEITYEECKDDEEQRILKRNNYIETIKLFGDYFINIVTDTDTQAEIAKEMGKTTDNLDEKDPFFETDNHGLGVINFKYQNEDKEDAKNFIKATKKVYINIINDLNDDQDLYTISRSDIFWEEVIKVEKPLQQKVLPTLAGLTFGLAFVSILPTKKNKE